MAEIGLRLKALTGYAVGVISFLVLAFALLASAEQILNGTSNDFESGSFFKLFNVLLQEGKMHYQHFWPELEFGWRVIVGSVIGFFAAAFGSVGGVGGGGIFVPMLTLITGFDPKTSTAISKCMITGAAGATVYYNLKLRHPILDLPIIDYDLSLLLQPMLLLGISIGVVLNILFAEWMVTVLLIILFIVTSTRSFFKGVETWKKETIIKKVCLLDLLSDYAGAEDAAYKLLPADPRVRNEGYKTPEVSIVDNVYWKDFIILIAVWVILLVLHFFKNYTSTCSTTYWILNLLQVPVAVGASGYEAVCLYKGTRMVMSSGEAVITWKVHQLILYCCCGILAGIVGGLLGLGGGFILGPLFLELGIPPQVSSATATFVMIFSSSMSVVQYYLLGRFPVPYALYFVAVATVAALAGQYVVRKIISIVGGVGIADTIKRIKEGRYMGFDNICEYKP
ncbi:hypothetical protein T459_30525 [Capsicum annuum]|uniref:Sulfite exporter TauE/SafE family protein 3-like n=1 Tax=Capsicum annuum TaxID=4072 RepID=A0A2G2Y8N6_CAPAN|nr:hypothetical protein T459_30525 [Capsicum annuum]